MSQDAHETQRHRRLKYGLNVTVAAVAAAALAVLINWIGYRQFVRFDFTATRQYSLSPQTLKVLEALEGQYRIATLFSRGGPYVEQARDLVDEYDRYAPRLTAQHIDPGRELGRMEDFFNLLRERYQEQLGTLGQVVKDGRDALSRTGQSTSMLLGPLRSLLQSPDLTDNELKSFLQSVAQAFGRFGTDFDAVDKQVDQMINHPLPRYTQAKSTLENLLVELHEKVFSLAIDRLTTAVEADAMPTPVEERLLEITDRLKTIDQEIDTAVLALNNAPVVEDYDKLISQLDHPEAVVLIGPVQIQVISLSEMFRQPDPNQVQPGQQPQLRFQGEEKITGSLVSMNLKHRPMVVFVSSGQNQALGPRGQFEQVAARLRNVNFHVQQWSPVAQPGPMGQPMPPAARPEPEPGQKAVWIVLPSQAPNPMNPAAAGGNQQVADLLSQRLEAGDTALVMISISPMARFGTTDPIAQTLASWGITPQTDRLVLRQIVLPDHRTRASSQLDVRQWPEKLPITAALAGMPGVFVQASPLVLGSGDGQNVRVWPLVQVSGDDLWTQRDLESNPNPKLDPATSGGPFVIAAAAQRDDKRLVVVGDPVWATDQITGMGPQGLPAEIFGAAFPANAELFVNSVYWLAGLDQLIAASPRTQDIRRVGPMTHTALVTLRWALLLGMPAAAGVAGVGVWSVRRRS